MNGWGWVGAITCLYLGGVGFGAGYSPLASVIMSFSCPWNVKIVAQFYATLHISDDDRNFQFLIGGKRFTYDKVVIDFRVETNPVFDFREET